MEAVWGICGECGSNFLIQLVREPTRENALLDLKFVSREGPVGDVVAGGHLGHVMREFLILEAVRRTVTLDFRRADFSLLGTRVTELPGRQS